MKLPPTDTGACGEYRGGPRHKRRGEQLCDPCQDAQAAYNRTRKRATEAKPRPPLQPCGTMAAYKRHRKRKEPVDAACMEANRTYDAERRRERGITQRTTMTSAEVIHEIEFLLKAGEGSHRILTATGYTRNPHSLKDRLRRAGRTDLTERVLRMEEMVAA